MTIRPAAVAGIFYEAEQKSLQRQVSALLRSAAAAAGPGPRVLIVPHAGFIYSGATAARAYQRLTPIAHEIERVVLLGPAHRLPLRGMAVPGTDAFATPLGLVPLDVKAIHAACLLADVQLDDEAHRLEHSLEVQLPFLQTVLSNFTLVPVVVGHCPVNSVAGAIDALCGGAETLLVVSTDLSHFLGYEQARRLDEKTAQRLLAKEYALDGHEACGAQALNGLMYCDHARSLTVEQLALCNSGDTAGDKNRVVGYGAFALH